MKTGLTRIILVLLCACALIQAGPQAQAEERQNRFEAGFTAGVGTGAFDNDRYKVFLFAAHLGYNIKTAPHLPDRSGTVSFFVEPQVNPIFSPRDAFEAGIGFGVQYLYPLTRKLQPYILGALGPHYLSLNSDKQAPGFNFQLAAGAGLYYFIEPDIAINAGWRFRHLSNAGLRYPNDGINMHCGVLGLSFFF